MKMPCCWICTNPDELDELDFSMAKRRRCTDIGFLVLFIAFWIGLIVIAGFSFAVGSPTRLMYGTDSFGNLCGRNNFKSSHVDRDLFTGIDLRTRPYVFYLNVHNLTQSLRICVSTCPDTTLKDEGELLIFAQRTNGTLCRYDYTPRKADDRNAYAEYTDRKVQEQLQKDICPTFPVPVSRPILNRCVPKMFTSASKQIITSLYTYLNSFDALQQVAADLYASRWEMAIMFGTAILVSFLMVAICHYMAALFSHIVLTAVSLAVLLLTLLNWWVWIDLKFQLEILPSIVVLEEDLANQRFFLVAAILMSIIAVIVIGTCISLRRRVQFLVSLFYEAGNCIQAMPLLVLQPIWTFTTLILFYGFWLFLVLAMATADYSEAERINVRQYKSQLSGTSSVLDTTNEYDAVRLRGSTASIGGSSQTDIARLSIINFTTPSWVRYTWLYLIVALLWTSEMISNSEQMVIAGAVSSWYFARDRATQSWCPIGRSIRRLVYYHLGSVAKGSLLIVLFKLPRLIITWSQLLVQRWKGTRLGDKLINCCACCLGCVERFVRYLNHNAYTIIAIESEDFCSSAMIAFEALGSNPARLALINTVGDFVLFLAKLAVTCITACVGLVLMQRNDDVHYFALPIVLISLAAFAIAHTILSVYEMVVDTIFLCYCEDMARNDGTPGREYCAPPSLLSFLQDEESGEGSQAGGEGGGRSSGGQVPMAELEAVDDSPEEEIDEETFQSSYGKSTHQRLTNGNSHYAGSKTGSSNKEHEYADFRLDQIDHY